MSELPAGAEVSASTVTSIEELGGVFDSDDGVDYYNICKKVDDVELADEMSVMLYM